MIREIFLIDRSVLQYHFSSVESSSDDDKAVLSSGFLSAIQDFSTHARSDALESFSTENEYFLYLQCPETGRVLVGVFERNAPEDLAREAMDKIMNYLRTVEMPDTEGLQLSPDEKERISKHIEDITIQLFSDEKLSRIVIKTLDSRNDIPLAFLIDSSNKSLITSFSRPKPLFKESQVREFLLVHSTLQKVFESMGINKNYSYFVIESDDYTVVACNGGRLLSVASGAMKTPKEDVYEAATTICYAESFETEIALTSEDSMVGKVIFSSAGRMSEKIGKKITQNSIIFISSLIKNVGTMFRLITRRPYTSFFARSNETQTWGIRILITSGMMRFELHELPKL